MSETPREPEDRSAITDPAALDPTTLEPDDLDGHTLDELVDYLDAGRAPVDRSIESSAACVLALSALERVRAISERVLAEDAERSDEGDESWIAAIMSNIGRESRAGRRVPLRGAAEWDLAVTEGALRGVVRAAGDADPAVITGRCVLDGEVETVGANVNVRMSVSVRWGHNMREAADAVRGRVRQALEDHSDVVVGAIDIEVDDLWRHPGAPATGSGA